MERLTDDTGTGLPPQLSPDKKVEIVGSHREREKEEERETETECVSVYVRACSYLEQRQMDQRAPFASMRKTTRLEMHCGTSS